MTAATDDWGLLQRYARERDERAFEALARRYVDLVYSAAVRRVGNHHMAEEITQAVFVILAKKARSIRPGPPLAGWLLMTVRCVARNAMKIEARRRRRHEQSAQALAAGAGGACSSDPSDVLIWQEVACVIDDAVLRLPSADRRAILLRFFEDRSIQDVAADLKVSEGAAKKRLGRAIDKLRRRLERKGVGVASVDAAAFTALLSKHVLIHAPGDLLGGIGATAATGAATGTGVALAKGAIQAMAWAKVKMAVVVVAGIALAGGASVALSERQPARSPASQPARGAMATTAPAAIAHFVFRHGTDDISGGGGRSLLKNAPVIGGNLVLNGRYGDLEMTGDGYAAKFTVPSLDYRHFTVAWRFKAHDFDTHGLYLHWNLLAGGKEWRWLEFTRLPSGVIRLELNNGNADDLRPELQGTNVRVNVWTTVVCSFDLTTRTVLVAVNGVAAPPVRLPDDFKLRVMAAPRDVDRLFTFTNYSNAMTFSGEVSELVVFPYAMSKSRIEQLNLSPVEE